MADELAAVVMAAGIGTRMKSAMPKHLHPILGRRMVDWVVDAARDAGVERIVVDASPEELALGEVNSGIYVFKSEQLWPALERLDAHNAQGELYVTDTLGLLVADGHSCAVELADDPLEAEGVNTRAELALAAASL